MDANRIATLDDIAPLHAAERGDMIALIFEGRSTTFADFDRHVTQVANGLAANGITAGTRIAYLGKNSDHYFELLFAAFRIGAVVVPINWRLAPPEIAYIVADALAPILFVGPEFVATAETLSRDVATLKTVIVMETGSEPEWPVFAAWRDRQSAERPAHRAKPADTAVQLYTSGTTGRPKGAMLTHDNFVSMRRHAQSADIPWSRWSDDDIALIAMPVGHIGGTGFG